MIGQLLKGKTFQVKTVAICKNFHAPFGKTAKEENLLF